MSRLSYEAPQVILAWRNAYRAANGCPPPGVRYERGWFIIPGSPRRYRRAQMEVLISRLRERSSATLSSQDRSLLGGEK
jgi:hypothetical protein